MKKTYKVEVDCASCANLMEETAKKINGIKEVTINFLTQKMEVDFDDNKDEKLMNILKNL